MKKNKSSKLNKYRIELDKENQVKIYNKYLSVRTKKNFDRRKYGNENKRGRNKKEKPMTFRRLKKKINVSMNPKSKSIKTPKYCITFHPY